MRFVPMLPGCLDSATLGVVSVLTTHQNVSHRGNPSYWCVWVTSLKARLPHLSVLHGPISLGRILDAGYGTSLISGCSTIKTSTHVLQAPHENLVIQPLDEEQLASLVAIEKRAYPAGWSEQTFRETLGFHRNRGFGLFQGVGGCLIGYTVVQQVADEYHLLNIAIDPQFQRQGLGREILGYVIADALQRSCAALYLELRASNLAAHALYLAQGFNEIGVRRDYYPSADGREDAILMALQLSLSL